MPPFRPRRTRSLGATLATVVLVLLVYAGQRAGLFPENSKRGAATTAAPNPSPAPAASTASKHSSGPRVDTPAPTSAAATPLDDGGIPSLFRDRKSDTWVEATGIVDRVLPDDTTGEEHQKFLVHFGSDLRVLVAHNTDAAKRVPLKAGDRVRIRGEYEYTDKGGTVHFTHKPKFQRRQPGGWIEHGGFRYE